MVLFYNIGPRAPQLQNFNLKRHTTLTVRYPCRKTECRKIKATLRTRLKLLSDAISIGIFFNCYLLQKRDRFNKFDFLKTSFANTNPDSFALLDFVTLVALLALDN